MPLFMDIHNVDSDTLMVEEVTKAHWETLRPFSSGGAYSNFMMDEGQDRVKASYKHNYGRLVKIKQKYNPTNLFRVNQNIRPA